MDTAVLQPVSGSQGANEIVHQRKGVCRVSALICWIMPNRRDAPIRQQRASGVRQQRASGVNRIREEVGCSRWARALRLHPTSLYI